VNSLVKIVNEVSLLEQKLIESEGQLTPEIEALLAVSGEMLPAKVDNYSMVLERFDALSEHYKERAAFFSKIAKQCEGVQDRLKENIKFAMKTLNVDELSGQDVKFKLQKVKSKVVIEDESLIPDDYYKSEIVHTLQKDKLKGDLEIGPIPGARLEESVSLKTYAATTTKKGKKNE
jgi:hypothetical protein